MDELSKRNFDTLAKAAKEQRDEIMELQEEVKRLKGIVAQSAQAVQQVAAIQQQVSILMARVMGSGSTT